ncbi:MAG TPA: phage portal protein, partial [Armatimonadota bacterium]
MPRIKAILEPVAGSALQKKASMSGGDSPHMGASVTQREIADWLPWRGSPDSDLLGDLGMLTGRSRDLVRNHGIASGVLQTQGDNVVGTGFRLSSTPDYRALARDKEWAEEWSTDVEAKWRSHANTKDIDAGHCLHFDGLTHQVFNGGFLNGEAIALPLWMPGTGGRYATKFQIIEADRLSNPNGRMDTDTLRAGIEIDPRGRPLAYWIQKAHPGDAYLSYSAVSQEWERIPAETAWGRPRVIHVHDKERSGQTRGKPALSAVLMQFKMFDQYTRTELQAAIVNAMIAAFIETPLEGEQIAAMFGGDVTS